MDGLAYAFDDAFWFILHFCLGVPEEHVPVIQVCISLFVAVVLCLCLVRLICTKTTTTTVEDQHQD